MFGVLPTPLNKSPNPGNIGFLGLHAVAQIANSLTQLIEDFRRFQRRIRDAKLLQNSVIWSKISFHIYDENRDFGMRVFPHKLMMKLIDYKRFIRNFTGLLRRNAECYADVVLPKLN